MEKHIFYGKYANLPLSQRVIPLDVEMYEGKTPDDLYTGIKMADEEIAQWKGFQEMLLKIADEYFNEKKD